MIRVNQDLSISEEQLKFETSRSGGPGGQNVNKVASRVMLLFDVDRSTALSEDQKKRVRERLANRINKDGVLRVVSQQHRTQLANRRAAMDRFLELLVQALRKPRPRRPTKLPQASKRRRLEEKARRGQLKHSRSETGLEDK